MVEPLRSKAALTPEARRAKPQGRQVGKWDSTRASLDLKKWGHQGQRPKNRDDTGESRGLGGALAPQR